MITLYLSQTALTGEHYLGNRMLEVKIATPKVAFVLIIISIIYVCYSIYCLFPSCLIVFLKSSRTYPCFVVIWIFLSHFQEEMRTSSKKVTRIFVARITPSVTEAEFRRLLFYPFFHVNIPYALFFICNRKLVVLYQLSVCLMVTVTFCAVILKNTVT